ncbi:putative protein kinase [Dickeya phage vB_DsoP_JA10]|uniref:Uncharacterized protein n=1 Tax=Dickeya phage vB_DsoP_JA10 TaxID=2283033 RepID=A0A384ZVT2_9CAUD|nr:serine-threonine kinase [Dickeya phage vB_DsoP_JA10]AXG66357.1 putative protein kinase [Dickeya phage vB_DsoP_JA10]
MTNNELTINSRSFNILRQVRELPIAQLELREPMLVAALADIVKHYVQTYGLSASYVGSNGWIDDLKETARHAGFEFLGSGYFSAAFSNDALPGRVVKVGFKKEDSGAAYAAFCKAHQGLKGIPNVYAVQRHSHCYTVVLDHLKEFTVANQTEEQYAQYKTICELVQHDGHINEDDYEGPLADTCNKIRSFFKGIASFDIHRGNVMVDKNGDLVITDPVSYSNDELQATDFEELKAELEANAEHARMQMAISRGRRKHMRDLDPFMWNHQKELRKERKARKKRDMQRKAARKARIDSAIDILMADPLLTGECVEWGDGSIPHNGWRHVPPMVRKIKTQKPQDEAPTVLNLNSIEALALELHGMTWQKPAGLNILPVHVFH